MMPTPPDEVVPVFMDQLLKGDVELGAASNNVMLPHKSNASSMLTAVLTRATGSS
jgi:hypothetical protein